MATPYMTAAQVGSYFVTQYYQLLQQRPEYVHKLYSDSSTMLRIDGNNREAATAMAQIHALVMSMRFTAIEIKTAHSLESWNGGVVVMVTGTVQLRNFSGRKKFAETFFLAPQEKGYFVLNDIFHFIDEDQAHPIPVAYMAQNNYNAKLNTVPAVPEPVPNYMLSGGLSSREYMAPAEVKENGTVDKYPLTEQHLQQVQDAEEILQDNSTQEVNGYLEDPINALQEVPPSAVEESISEPQKHTYASILRVAKGLAPSSAPTPANKNTSLPASEWTQISQNSHQPTQPLQALQQSNEASMADSFGASEAFDEVSAMDEKGEIKSVYVRNLSPSITASEVEEEFRKFGQLSSEGVAIRRIKDTDVCYAFVEFEEIGSVQEAIKAGAVQVAGRQLFVEERRANSSFARGRGRGRGRASYQLDTSRGRIGGRSYGRGVGQSGGIEYNRQRGTGSSRQTTHQDKEFYSGY
ncbi:hypothetical protein Droror1_Dr00009283 [Drosera rotundifolia]